MIREHKKARRRNNKTPPVPRSFVPVSRPHPAALELAIWPDPVLRTPAEPVPTAHGADDWLGQVIARMIQLMRAHKGVGLAAPQVGLPLRLFIMSQTGGTDEARAFINPVLVEQEGWEEAEEGCLSLPEVRGKISRYTRLKLLAIDSQGREVAETLEGFPARIVQHENDHLDGVLIIDRMSPMARVANRRKIRALEDKAQQHTHDDTKGIRSTGTVKSLSG